MDPSMATGAPASDESRRTCEPIERMTLLARVFRATPGERFTRWSAIPNHSPLGHDGLGWSAMALPGRGPLAPSIVGAGCGGYVLLFSEKKAPPCAGQHTHRATDMTLSITFQARISSRDCPLAMDGS
jgi:hypothetical protein